jgi:hypothetical protein
VSVLLPSFSFWGLFSLWDKLCEVRLGNIGALAFFVCCVVSDSLLSPHVRRRGSLCFYALFFFAWMKYGLGGLGALRGVFFFASESGLFLFLPV